MFRQRPVSCLALALLLACASVPLLARTALDEQPANGGACPQEEVAAIVTDGNTPAPPRPATPVRNKYAKPATPAARSQTTGGGGESDGVSLPRARNGKWHSFLPGMFR
ncbi:MAG: hypothetical protein QM599_05100 [Pseudoxanthomonas sp.]